MDEWVTWENGLFVFALLIAVSSLVGMMRTLHDRMVVDITEKIETARNRRVDEELLKEREKAHLERIRVREQHLEQIRNGRPAA